MKSPQVISLLIWVSSYDIFTPHHLKSREIGAFDTLFICSSASR